MCGVFLLCLLLVGGPHWSLTLISAVIAALATYGCVRLGDFAEKTFGRKDASHCTLDEWAGQAVALIYIPLGTNWRQHPIAVGVAFLAFRLFDIVKPPPARQAEKLPKGIGVVADDLIAGVYANIASQILLHCLILKLCVGL